MNNRIYYSEEAETYAKRRQTVASLIFTVFGVMIGGAIALLYTPKSGDKIREDLASKISDGAEASASAIKRVEDQVSELRDKVENRIAS